MLALQGLSMADGRSVRSRRCLCQRFDYWNRERLGFSRSLIYASALGASATRAVGTTDGVLTNVQAEQLIAEQPVTVSREPSNTSAHKRLLAADTR